MCGAELEAWLGAWLLGGCCWPGDGAVLCDVGP